MQMHRTAALYVRKCSAALHRHAHRAGHRQESRRPCVARPGKVARCRSGAHIRPLFARGPIVRRQLPAFPHKGPVVP